MYIYYDISIEMLLIHIIINNIKNLHLMTKCDEKE